MSMLTYEEAKSAVETFQTARPYLHSSRGRRVCNVQESVVVPLYDPVPGAAGAAQPAAVVLGTQG